MTMSDETPNAARILVVDDEEMIRPLLTQILVREGYDVTTATDGQEAIDLLLQERFDVVITDMVMPGVNGMEVVRIAKAIDPDYPVIVMTGYPSTETMTRLVRLGASDYLAKPWAVDVITATVAKLVEMRRMGGPPSQDPNPGESNPGPMDDPDHHSGLPDQDDADPQTTGPDATRPRSDA